ncbi:hypothetical protein Efla_006853 [Eimeria flavescens]
MPCARGAVQRFCRRRVLGGGWSSARPQPTVVHGFAVSAGWVGRGTALLLRPRCTRDVECCMNDGVTHALRFPGLGARSPVRSYLESLCRRCLSERARRQERQPPEVCFDLIEFPGRPCASYSCLSRAARLSEQREEHLLGPARTLPPSAGAARVAGERRRGGAEMRGVALMSRRARRSVVAGSGSEPSLKRSLNVSSRSSNSANSAVRGAQTEPRRAPRAARGRALPEVVDRRQARGQLVVDAESQGSVYERRDPGHRVGHRASVRETWMMANHGESWASVAFKKKGVLLQAHSDLVRVEKIDTEEPVKIHTQHHDEGGCGLQRTKGHGEGNGA